MDFRVRGSGLFLVVFFYSFDGLRFRVQGLGFGVQGLHPT